MRTDPAATAAATLLLGVALLLTATPATAQEIAGAPDAELKVEFLDDRSHPDVAFVVSVPRELVGVDLAADAFTVTEQGSAVPVDVTRLSTDDLEVVLLIDTSGSMAGDPLAAAQGAVRTFVEQVPPGVQVAVVGFGDTARVATGFTTDLDAVVAAADGLVASGETALYDGIAAAADLFPPSETTRRNVVVLSDGGDTVSVASLQQAIIGVIGAEARFYAVELQSPENDPAALDRLATATSGTVVPADDPDALAGIFDEIAAELVNQYLVEYRSESYGPTAVAVSVAAGGLVANATRDVRHPAPPPPPPTVPPTTLPVPAPALVHPDPEPVPPPTLPAPSVVEPGPFATTDARNLGLGALFAAFALATMLVWSRQRAARRPTGQASRGVAAGKSAVTGLADRATLLAERTLEKRGGSGLNTALEAAGLSIRPGEYAVLVIAAAVGGFVAGWYFVGALVGAVLAVLAVLGSRVLLVALAGRRRDAFAAQLGDTLQLVSGAMRAGYGLMQAFDTVATESLPPTSDEFRRLKVEAQLGRDMGEALHAMAERVQNEDFKWVVEAIEIHRDIGGDLAEIFASVSATIRDRNKIRRQIRALSAEGRMSAVILLILPFAVGGITALTNPGYIGELLVTTPGRFMIAAGLVLMAVGTVWTRRIVKVVF